MVTRHPQADVAKPSTVNLSSKEAFTLGGDPSPSPSHPSCPTAPCPCLAALFELAGHVHEAHDIAHVLGNQLILLVPWGREFDVQISYQYGDMPHWAFIPCSLDLCQCRQIGWWSITSHSIIMLASQHHHKGDTIWSAHPPFLNFIEFVWLPEVSNPPLLDADCVGCKDIITAQKMGINACSDFCFHQDPKINIHLSNCPQGRLQTSISTTADVIQCNSKRLATISL